MRQTALRRERIVDLLKVHQSLSVAGLAERCLVSIGTIRTDLDALEKAGQVVRTHGGALLHRKPQIEPLAGDVNDAEAEANLRIAAMAAGLVRDGDNIFIAASGSTRMFARQLTGVRPITVMTNGIDIASDLAEVGQVTVFATGGRLNLPTQSFLGTQAEASLGSYTFDKLFLGVDGFDLQLGLTSFDEQGAALGRAAIARARQVIVLAGSSRISRIGLHRIASIDKVRAVVTDRGMDALTRTELVARGIDVLDACADRS